MGPECSPMLYWTGQPGERHVTPFRCIINWLEWYLVLDGDSHDPARQIEKSAQPEKG